VRVLHVITRLSGGGAERFVTSLATKLADHVGRCGLMSIYAGVVPEALAASANVDVIDIGRRRRYDAAFPARMMIKMRAWRPDVVHVHMHGGTYWGRLAAVATGVRALVRTEHHPCDTRRLPGTALADRVLNSATSATVTFFEEQARFLADFEHLPARKCKVIPNGIEHRPLPLLDDATSARERLGVGRGTFAIFVLGSMYGPKNPGLAVEALAQLPSNSLRRAHLFFIGDGPDRSRLVAMVEQSNLVERVTFLGFRTDAAELLPAANLLLVPSLSEGMPLAMLEAMSTGVPALSTPWLGAHDMLRGGELGTIAHDFQPSTLAECIAKIMDDQNAAQEIARKAQGIVRSDYDIATTAARHAQLYELLICEGRAG
jgi:glycosyltransferase involved in cell wall biosynthesis